MLEMLELRIYEPGGAGQKGANENLWVTLGDEKFADFPRTPRNGEGTISVVGKYGQPFDKL